MNNHSQYMRFKHWDKRILKNGSGLIDVRIDIDHEYIYWLEVPVLIQAVLYIQT